MTTHRYLGMAKGELSDGSPMLCYVTVCDTEPSSLDRYVAEPEDVKCKACRNAHSFPQYGIALFIDGRPVQS